MSEHLLSLLDRREYIELLTERGIKVLFILAAVLVCAKLLRLVKKRLLAAARSAHSGDAASSDHDKRITTVVSLLHTVLRISLWLFGALMALHELGFNIMPILTGAGVAGVAVGFGSQSLVKDVISGFFLLVEDQIRVGDVIKVNSNLSGTVERMHLRVTAIRDGDGTLHIIPNGQITSVSNMTYGFGCAVVVVPVPYAADLAKVNAALSSALNELAADPKWKSDLLEAPSSAGITKFETDHMTIEVSVRTKAHSRWSVASEIRSRVKLALDAAGVEFPKGLTVTLEQG